MGTCPNTVRVPEGCGHHKSTKEHTAQVTGASVTPDIVATAQCKQMLRSYLLLFSQSEVLWFPPAELKDVAFLRICYR